MMLYGYAYTDHLIQSPFFFLPNSYVHICFRQSTDVCAITIPSIIFHHERECLASLEVLYMPLVVVKWLVFIFQESFTNSYNWHESYSNLPDTVFKVLSSPLTF